MHLGSAVVVASLLLSCVTTLNDATLTYTLQKIVKGETSQIKCTEASGNDIITWRKNGKLMQCFDQEDGSGSIRIISPEFRDSGNYSCEWQSANGPRIQHIWVAIVEILTPPVDRLRAKLGSSIVLHCCVFPPSERVTWSIAKGRSIQSSEKYRINNEEGTLEIANFQRADATDYRCQYILTNKKRNFLYRVRTGTTVTNRQSCRDRSAWDVGYDRSILLRGLVKLDGVQFTYKSQFREKSSTDYIALNKAVCSHLEQLKQESLLGNFFKMSCEVVQVDPTTSEVITRVTVLRYYLLATGFSANPADFGHALHFILQRKSDLTFSYDFEVDKPSHSIQKNLIRFEVIEDTGVPSIKCTNVVKGIAYTWRKDGELVRGLDSGTMKFSCPTPEVAGNYTCEGFHGEQLDIQPIWVIVKTFRSKLSTGSGSSAAAEETGDANDKLDLGDIGRNNVQSYYDCSFSTVLGSTPLNIGPSYGLGNPTRPLCDELLSEAHGKPISIQLIGAIVNHSNELVYKPQFNELLSDYRLDLNRTVCSHLEDLRRDSALERHFKMECEVVEMHPITSAVITRVTVKEYYLRSTGFGAHEAGLRKALGYVLQRRRAYSVTYSFEVYSPPLQAAQSYKTLFIEGLLYRQNELVLPFDANEDDDFLSSLNRDVCNHVEQRRTKDKTFTNCPISCTVYAMKPNSKVVAQLSIYDRHLNAVSIKLDESVIAKVFTDFFKRTEAIIADIEYSPKVVHPGVFAAGPIYENGKMIEYNWKVRTSPEYTRLIEAMSEHISATYPLQSPLDGVPVVIEVNQFHWTNSHLIVSLSFPNKDLLRYSKLLDLNFNYMLASADPVPSRGVFFKIVHLYSSNPVAKLHNRIAADSVTFLLTTQNPTANTLQSNSLSRSCDESTVQYVRLDHTAPVTRQCEVIQYGQTESIITQIMEVKKENALQLNAATHHLKPIWST